MIESHFRAVTNFVSRVFGFSLSDTVIKQKESPVISSNRVGGTFEDPRARPAHAN